MVVRDGGGGAPVGIGGGDQAEEDQGGQRKVLVGLVWVKPR